MKFRMYYTPEINIVKCVAAFLFVQHVNDYGVSGYRVCLIG